MKFTKTHEWVELKNDHIAIIGISRHAQEQLGEVVYVELPQVGKSLSIGQEAAVLESVKAAADVYSPVSGTIESVNENLNTTPELVNSSPEKDGWIFTLKLANPDELKALMDENEYLSSLS